MNDRGGNGKVVTFYSYSGGTGQSMALANVAWILAANGKRVLVADWDLDAPGLHRYFRPFITAEVLRSAGGIHDLIHSYEGAAMRSGKKPEDWHREFARVSRYAFPIDWPHFPGDGRIDFLGAGNWHPDYVRNIYERDWDEFFERLDGGRLFDALRADMQAKYDFALVDGRSGLSDGAAICAVHLPDVVVDCFTLSERGIDGAGTVAANIARTGGRRAIRVLPVPMRVDLAEKTRADRGRLAARTRLTGLPAGLDPAERDAYWATVEVPYQPSYSFEETLATFADRPGSRTSLLTAYETLTRYLTDGDVTGLPPIDEKLRQGVAARFVRAAATPEPSVEPHPF